MDVNTSFAETAKKFYTAIGIPAAYQDQMVQHLHEMLSISFAIELAGKIPDEELKALELRVKDLPVEQGAELLFAAVEKYCPPEESKEIATRVNQKVLSEYMDSIQGALTPDQLKLANTALPEFLDKLKEKI